MRTSCFLLALAAIIWHTPTAHAQFLELGVRAGTNIATPSADSAVSSHTGIVLGAMAAFTIIEPLRLQVEAQYVQKGGTFTVSTPAGPDINDLSLNYLEIPISLKLPLDFYPVQVYGLFGTTIGTLISASNQYQYADGRTGTEDIAEDFDPANLSLELGAGVSYAISEHLSAVAETRYSFGVVDLADEQRDLFNQNSWKTRDIKILAGITFSI